MFGGLMKTKLYKHQRDNLEFHLARPRSADFSEMGVGKTIIALGKVAHLIASNKIHRALVICPMSAIPVWEKQIAQHTNMTSLSLIGSLWQKGAKLTEHQHEDIYIISYDSIPGRERTKDILLNALISFNFDMIVCDEVTYIKNYETVRFQSVLHLCDRAKYTIFLTGTPITNRPDSIFNIYRALDRGETFGENYFRSRNKYFHNVGMAFPLWKMRETMKDELIHKMYIRAVRVRKDECLSLPPKIFSPRYCDLSAQARNIYEPVAEELLKKFKIGEHKFRITTPLTKLSKLSQICSGFLYDNRGEALYIKDNAKVSLLKEILEEIGDEKVIIYTRWKEDVKIIDGVLKTDRQCRTLTGATIDRGSVINDFQTNPQVKVLISNITVGGYAVTLTAACYVIYFSLNFALTDWLQSQDRIHRVGQTRTCVYIPLLCTNTIDTYIYQALEDKVDLSTSIVDPGLMVKLTRNLDNENR